MVHPCCHFIPTCMAAKFVAICDLIFGLVGMFWFIYMLDGYEYGANRKHDSYNESVTSTEERRIRPLLAVLQPNVSEDVLKSKTEPTISETEQFPAIITSEEFYIDGDMGNIGLSGFYTTMNLSLSVLLLYAVKTKSVPKLKAWFFIRLTITLLKCIMYLTYLISDIQIDSQIPHFGFTVVHLYGLWVVCDFIQEIKRENSVGETPTENFDMNKQFSNIEQWIETTQA